MDEYGTCPGPINAGVQFSTSTSAGHDLFPPLRASASDLTQSSVADASDSNSPPSTSSSIHFGTDPGANSNLHSQNIGATPFTTILGSSESGKRLEIQPQWQPYHRHNLSMGSIPSNGSYQRPASNGLHQIPRLAPPADIVPGNSTHARRRPTLNSTSPKKFQAPSLSQQSSSSSTMGTYGSYHIPATPPRPQPSFKAPSSATTAILGKHCTPTQKTIMEQDAVETLVFMGSPENSGYYNDSRSQFQPPNNSQNSSRFTPVLSSNENVSASTSSAAGLGVAFNFEPRRQDALHSKRVSFADPGGEDQHNPYTSYHQPRLEQNAGDEIDRMLDEMGDSDNEQDYDWFAHMSGARDNFSLPQQSSQWSNGQHNLPNSAIFQPRQ
ncbi:uncharacterized protein GIQ15_02322 [Arthroderma uncinatum]|uniref:uncharacterized protein n=1 Tax=Arthroderma uncinatum TaxID=74035 RepID=UPI00144A6D0D|nr:uncharacterized protein GIQ15_02322 [Arthroderma uncinatum]KAF3482998.1 hypothetical protein GIQ15_02322 [Arthroderma uncinatum]